MPAFLQFLQNTQNSIHLDQLEFAHERLHENTGDDHSCPLPYFILILSIKSTPPPPTKKKNSLRNAFQPSNIQRSSDALKRGIVSHRHVDSREATRCKTSPGPDVFDHLLHALVHSAAGFHETPAKRSRPGGGRKRGSVGHKSPQKKSAVYFLGFPRDMGGIFRVRKEGG